MKMSEALSFLVRLMMMSLMVSDDLLNWLKVRTVFQTMMMIMFLQLLKNRYLSEVL